MTAKYEGENFVGHDPNEGCEHRSVGSHRAWCFNCHEWCSPSEPCVRCERAGGAGEVICPTCASTVEDGNCVWLHKGKFYCSEKCVRKAARV